MTDTVLYIDDRSELPERVGEVLAQAGYELVHTKDPVEAVRIAREDHPALVLIEVLLSDQDGFEVIRSIHRTRTQPPVPVVVVTRGERTSQLYGQAIELGVEEFICKPVVEAQILEAVFAFASKREAPEPQAKSAVPTTEFFEGRLEEQLFPQLLGRLHRSGASGVLTLQHGSDTRSVQLRNGSPIEVEKHRNVEPVADYLLKTGRIDDGQYHMLVDHLMAQLGAPREILIGMDALSEAELAAATHEQSHAILLEMFEWVSGRFTFQRDQQLTCANSLEAVCDPSELVFAGLKRISNDVIRAALERRLDSYVSTPEIPESHMAGLGLTPAQRKKIKSLAGETTLAEVLASKLVEERSLYGLFATGAVFLDEIPVLLLDEELKLDELVEIRELPKQVAPPVESSERPGAIQIASSPGTHLSAIDDIAERLDAHDDFALFGIDGDGRDAEVRAAYDALLAALNLDGIPPEHDDVRIRARALQVRLEQAFRRVRTADVRRAFAGLRKKLPVQTEERKDGSRAVDAESWFRKGEGLLGNDEYDQAVEAFGMAVHLDPDQGDYAAYLGYTLYRGNPNDTVIRREALEHVAKGVKLGPGREKPLLFLSRIFRETGDIGMAAKVLRRALAENPDSPALAQEMCLIEPDRKKSKANKFLDRFRGR